MIIIHTSLKLSGRSRSSLFKARHLCQASALWAMLTQISYFNLWSIYIVGGKIYNITKSFSYSDPKFEPSQIFNCYKVILEQSPSNIFYHSSANFSVVRRIKAQFCSINNLTNVQKSTQLRKSASSTSKNLDKLINQCNDHTIINTNCPVKLLGWLVNIINLFKN